MRSEEAKTAPPTEPTTPSVPNGKPMFGVESELLGSCKSLEVPALKGKGREKFLAKREVPLAEESAGIAIAELLLVREDNWCSWRQGVRALCYSTTLAPSW